MQVIRKNRTGMDDAFGVLNFGCNSSRDRQRLFAGKSNRIIMKGIRHFISKFAIIWTCRNGAMCIDFRCWSKLGKFIASNKL